MKTMPVNKSAEFWFEEALAANAFSVWFQPVINTKVRRIVGHECLIRLTTGQRREGAEILAAAAGHDLRAFDSYTRQLAIRTIYGQTNPGARYFLNFIPSAIIHPSEILENTSPRPANIVMEATGCNRNPDIVHLRRIGDYLREHGVGFALDDVTDNPEALRLICDIRPDYIKLETHQVSYKLVNIAERQSVRVIAKNVERVSTMEDLWNVGVYSMQGHLFGCPSPEITAICDDTRVPQLEISGPHDTAPVLTHLNQQFLSGIGVP
jgi:EAL domain-containing protein (putative c-di-GMP-specific phosphodiesterase class I)